MTANQNYGAELPAPAGTRTIPGPGSGQSQIASEPARATGTRNWQRAKAAVPVLMAAVPVLMVNAVAFTAQLAFLNAHLPWPTTGRVLFALTLESIANYLAYHAHRAQVANDSALRLRAAAYLMGAAIGAMNYSHYMDPGWLPTFTACAVGLCSAASPWLWSIHTRRTARDRLLALGEIEQHALRLGPTRWLWHGFRSAQVMWAATWNGTRNPQAAIAEWNQARNRNVTPEPRRVQPPVPSSVSAGLPPRRNRELEQAPAAAGQTEPELAAESSPAPASGGSQNRGRDTRTEAELIDSARAAYAELAARNPRGRATQGEVALKISKAKAWVGQRWAEIQSAEPAADDGQAVAQ